MKQDNYKLSNTIYKLKLALYDTYNYYGGMSSRIILDKLINYYYKLHNK